jgi:hypothetical protein
VKLILLKIDEVPLNKIRTISFEISNCLIRFVTTTKKYKFIQKKFNKIIKIMKQNFFIICTIACFFCAKQVFSQSENVGIGTANPNKSAILELNSSQKGFLMPRMTQNQKYNIINPAEGLVIYQTDFNSGIYSYNGKIWEKLSYQNSIAASGANWTIGGNDLSAIAIADRWLGTSSNHPLIFKVNNSQAGNISSTGASTFFGYESGINNTSSGIFNTGIGAFALKANTTGSQNTAIGVNALLANSTGVNNVALGSESMRSNVSGFYNMAIGSFSLRDNRTGQENVGVGLFTLAKNTVGRSSVAIGTNALSEISSGNFNVAIGNNSMGIKTGGDENVAIGLNALYSNPNGSENVAVGSKALSNSIGSGNIAIGFSAGQNEAGSNKLYISNSNSTNPLIKGDFNANNLQINSKTTGYLAIGDFTTAAAASPGTGGIPLPANIGQAGGYRLVVQDGILCEKVKVALRSNTGADWADYVFEPEYKANMMTLEEVEKFTLENKHLPNVLSAKQMVEEGLDVAKTSKMFMEKIEELTLYMIELNKEVKALKAENEALKVKK